ncbi:hypothetical protein Vretimale_4543 [Volvox reticuliferus]|uniref:Uncharacterized protein n=1 Tax=Volvox reticuliferus TaxID=1737510 RepID=A0A8J4G2K2_9CHLO|nr:hypothetical protein Vretifemale_3173 [Volvox reticuliferus]GIL99374.1 hypothetical protein Vretimale_4543 [Volvox reticuliferus]
MMALNIHASVLTRCNRKVGTSRPTRTVVTRGVPPRQDSPLDMSNVMISTAAAAMLLVVPPALSSDSVTAPVAPAPAESASTATTNTDRSSNVSSISFARVDMSVTEKLRQRDENMAWKCKGVNMYDCDGELAEAAEKRFEEMANIFRGGSKE